MMGRVFYFACVGAKGRSMSLRLVNTIMNGETILRSPLPSFISCTLIDAVSKKLNKSIN